VTRPKSCYIDDELWDKLEEVAFQEGRNRQKLISFVLRAYCSSAELDGDGATDIASLESILWQIESLVQQAQALVAKGVENLNVRDEEVDSVMRRLVIDGQKT
jgi:hypothetical protein